jgi:hypothetical protein
MHRVLIAHPAASQEVDNMADLFKYSDFEFGGTLVNENTKTYFIDDGIQVIPIPKNQVRKMRRVGRTDDWLLTIPNWLAKDRGIV